MSSILPAGRRIISVDHERAVEVSWPIVEGKRIPVQHGYPLFGSLCHVLPIHGDTCSWQVLPVRGAIDGSMLRLTRQSYVTIRAMVEDLPTLMQLSGTRLEVDYCLVRLGDAVVSRLKPFERLSSRIVVIKCAGKERAEEQSFWVSLCKQLCETTVDHDRIGATLGKRRVVRVGAYTVCGWAVDLMNLAPGDSLRIQAAGIGAKRHMGCGVFAGG